MYGYLKYRLKIILFVFFAFLVFSFTAFLYYVPLENIGYVIFINFYFLFVITIFDIYKYFKVKKLFEKVIVEDNSHFLLKTNAMYENEYNEIIEKLYLKTNESISNHDKKIGEILDYYTLWAHQIKTPIQALKLLVSDNESEKQLFKIEQYVDIMMQYLRVDNISNDLIYKKYNLDYLLKQSIKKYTKHFINSGIKLDYIKTDYEIITDEKWFCFVIEQLISNALKYTDKGFIKIYFSDPYLYIEDSGIGIKEEDVPRIFEKGYTGYNGRINKKSSGIGLFLCKKIFDKLNYPIYVESKIKVGSKFYIKLH